MTTEKDRRQNPADNDAAETRAEEMENTISSHRLFGGLREIWIEHAGERYRLRITRRNKLILQK